QRPAMRNVVRVDREFDDPFPPEARDLDVVYVVLFYHDTVWMGAHRDRLNHAVFEALRPGGSYIIVDHSARPGSGTADAQTLHRIDEAFVIAEVERAGFKLHSVGDFLRNAADKRDWNASPRTAGERRGTSDRFALQFVKPARNFLPGAGGSPAVSRLLGHPSRLTVTPTRYKGTAHDSQSHARDRCRARASCRGGRRRPPPA